MCGVERRTNSNGFQREHDPDPKHRGWSKADASQPQRDGAWFPRAMAQGSPSPCSGQRGRAGVMQHGRGLAHCIIPVTTPYYWKLLWAQWLLYPSEKPSVLHQRAGFSCSVPSSGKQAQGQLLQRGPQTRGAWKQGLVEAGRTKGNCSSVVHCTGNYVWENIQLTLGFVHVKPTADLILCLQVYQLTASWLPTAWKEASAPRCFPCILPPLYQLSYLESEKTLIHWVTTPWGPRL